MGLGIGALPLLAVLLQVRRRLLIGRVVFGALLGVASGAIGALVLHAACPVGGWLHVLCGHVGALLAGQLLGAGAARLIAR
jgi:hypothetical protein